MPKVRRELPDLVDETTDSASVPGTGVRESGLGTDEVRQQEEVASGTSGAGADDASVRVVPTIEVEIDGMVSVVKLKNWRPGVSMAAIDRGLHIAMREVQSYQHHLIFRRDTE